MTARRRRGSTPVGVTVPQRKPRLVRRATRALPPPAARKVTPSSGAVNAPLPALHFFVPGAARLSGGDEAAYLRLRAQSEVVVGCDAKRLRIVGLSCRFNGHDENIAVGEQLPDGAGLVVAIFDHGRAEGYVVHTATGAADQPLRLRRHVYSMTEFN